MPKPYFYLIDENGPMLNDFFDYVETNMNCSSTLDDENLIFVQIAIETRTGKTRDNHTFLLVEKK